MHIPLQQLSDAAFSNRVYLYNRVRGTWQNENLMVSFEKLAELSRFILTTGGEKQQTLQTAPYSSLNNHMYI